MYLQQGGSEFAPINLNHAQLQKINKNEIVIQKWPPPLKYRYYKLMLDSVSITVCQCCQHVSTRINKTLMYVL